MQEINCQLIGVGGGVTLVTLSMITPSLFIMSLIVSFGWMTLFIDYYGGSMDGLKVCVKQMDKLQNIDSFNKENKKIEE